MSFIPANDLNSACRALWEYRGGKKDAMRVIGAKAPNLCTRSEQVLFE